MNLQFLTIGQYQGRDVAFFLDPAQQVVHAYPIVGTTPAPQPPQYFAPVPYYGPTPAAPAPVTSTSMVPQGFNETPPPPKPKPVPPPHLRGVFEPQGAPGAAVETRHV